MSESTAVTSERWDAPQFADATDALMTASELQQLQREAYDEAYAQGLERGHADGLAKGLAAAGNELAERGKLLKELFDYLSEPLKTTERAVENQLTQMIAVMFKRLFRRQLKMDPDSIVGLVRDATGMLPLSSREIQVQLHPEDAERIQAIMEIGEEEQVEGTNHARWRLVKDPGITRGGCRISSECSSIDARVETQIENVVNQLIGDQRA